MKSSNLGTVLHFKITYRGSLVPSGYCHDLCCCKLFFFFCFHSQSLQHILHFAFHGTLVLNVFGATYCSGCIIDMSKYRPGVGNLFGMTCHFSFFWLTTVPLPTQSSHLQESDENTSLPSLFDPLSLALSIIILFFKKNLPLLGLHSINLLTACFLYKNKNTNTSFTILFVLSICFLLYN